MGPYIVVDCNGRQVTDKTHDGAKQQMYNDLQVKPYYNDWYNNIHFHNSKAKVDIPTYSVHLSEEIKPYDPRAWKSDGLRDI